MSKIKFRVSEGRKITLYLGVDFQALSNSAKTAAADAKDSADAAEISASAANSDAFDAAQSASNASDSETNAATSESNALTYQNNAAQSASDAEDSADDAELQAQSEVPFTDSDGINFDKGAKGWAGDAEGFAGDAEQTVTDFNDALDPQDGNILRGNGTQYEGVNEFLSPLAYTQYGVSAPNKTWAADNFDLRGTSPATELTGRSYIDKNIGLGDYIMLDTSGLPASTSDRNFRIFIVDQTRTVSSGTSILLYNDETNFIEVELLGRGRLRVFETLAGVTTEIFSEVIQQPDRFIYSRKIYYDNADQRVFLFSQEGAQNTITSTVFSGTGDLNGIGLKTTRQSPARIINYRLELQ